MSVLASLMALGEKQPLDRYQSIIDRQMFGALPPDFDPTKSPAEVAKSSSRAQKELTQEQEKLQSAIAFYAINVTPEGETAVGFTDNSDPKVPKHYYLKVGESRDGWQVKEADSKAESPSMTVVKDGVEVSLTLGGDSAKGGGTTSKAGTAASPMAGERRPSLLGGGFGGSLRSRRQKLREQQKAADDAAEAKRAEQEAERQAQAAAEKAERDAEREQQRQQLMAIQEELRKAREQRQQQASEKDENDDAQ